MTRPGWSLTLRFLGRIVELPTVRPGWWPQPRQPGQYHTANDRDDDHPRLVPTRLDRDGDGEEFVYARPDTADVWDQRKWQDRP